MQSPNGSTPLLVLGTHAFAEEVADLIDETPPFELMGFVENLDRERCANDLLGRRVYWVDELAHLPTSYELVCGIGTTKRQRYVQDVARFRQRFTTLIHPTAHVSRTAKIGAGGILSVNTIIASHAVIGRHVIINRAATVGHHTRVGDFVTISPAATIAGKCEIGDGAYIAMGSIVIDYVKVGRNSVVGAGAVVTKDVPDNVQVVGVPARIVKEGIDGR